MNGNLERDGFLVVRGVFGPQQIGELRDAVAPLLERCGSAGVRGLVEKADVVRGVAESSGIRSLVDMALGDGGRLVRSILFNKHPEANWHVTWHQDLAIATRERHDVEGFSNWSVKGDIPHVQPPVSVLERMVTVRLHLDDADESNGALWVSPGSHRRGRLDAGRAAEMADQLGKHLCTAKAGDVLLMKPLVLHASRKATSSASRRVVHFEFANVLLPVPLQWRE